MASIRISQLNSFTTIKDEDFIPLVDSSSLTTYRVTVTTFNDWLADSGSALSASYAANSDYALSSSWASSSISSSTTSNLMYPNTSTSSYSLNSLSSSWSDRSGVAVSAISTSGTASFATSTKSASYAGTSSVAITASYINFSLGVPPTSSYAYSASFSYNTRSSSYAQTASWAGQSDTAKTASYIATSGGGAGIITKNFNNIGASWMVANPGFSFAVDNDMFVYNSCLHSGRRILSKINMKTNVVTHLQQWPIDSWNLYGRPFIRPEDGKTRAIINTSGYEYDYNITDNILTQFAASNGLWLSLPVIVTNWSNVLRPDLISLYGSYYADALGNSPTLAWMRQWHNGSAWTYAFTSSIDLRNCVNNTEFRKFYNYSTNPTIEADTLLWDFNYIKNRYYLLDTNTGYLHIFSHTTGNITSSWVATSITYEMTLAVPLPHQEIWADAASERMLVDYDLTTGDEKGIVMNRRGNTVLNGSVTYINWPEYGNW